VGTHSGLEVDIMKLVKYIVEGEAMHTGYGCAWRDFLHRRTACYPIPLNIIMNILRRLWHWALWNDLKHTKIDQRVMKMYNEIWDDGFDSGKKFEKQVIIMKEKYGDE